MIGKPDRYEIRLTILETDLSHLAIGQPIRLQLNQNGNKILTGKITQISTERNNTLNSSEEKTFSATALLDEKNYDSTGTLKLFVGGFGNAKILVAPIPLYQNISQCLSNVFFTRQD